MSLGIDVALEDELPVFSEFVQATDLFIQLGVDHYVEIVVDLLDLGDVLVLHLPSGQALAAWRHWLWETDLVHDDVVDVDLELG